MSSKKIGCFVLIAHHNITTSWVTHTRPLSFSQIWGKGFFEFQRTWFFLILSDTANGHSLIHVEIVDFPQYASVLCVEMWLVVYELVTVGILGFSQWAKIAVAREK